MTSAAPPVEMLLQFVVLILVPLGGLPLLGAVLAWRRPTRARALLAAVAGALALGYALLLLERQSPSGVVPDERYASRVALFELLPPLLAADIIAWSLAGLSPSQRWLYRAGLVAAGLSAGVAFLLVARFYV